MKAKSRFKISKIYSTEPISEARMQKIEDLLACLIAQAYAKDNPHLFERHTDMLKVDESSECQ